jgi:hypothetical protein
MLTSVGDLWVTTAPRYGIVFVPFVQNSFMRGILS